MKWSGGVMCRVLVGEMRRVSVGNAEKTLSSRIGTVGNVDILYAKTVAKIKGFSLICQISVVKTDMNLFNCLKNWFQASQSTAINAISLQTKTVDFV
jgi:hypothetical protein